MKKVTKTTFNELQKIRNSNSKCTISLQKQLKSGRWGKTVEYKLYGAETSAADVINRLEKLNPGNKWREVTI